jgi:hypothetical protein
MKNYALGSFVLWAAMMGLFGIFLGGWGALPAGVLTTVVLVLISRSGIRSRNTAESTAIVFAAATVVGTIIGLVRLAAGEAKDGVWWPAVLVAVAGTVVVVGGGWLAVRRRRLT